jgi:hypothetical protein
MIGHSQASRPFLMVIELKECGGSPQVLERINHIVKSIPDRRIKQSVLIGIIDAVTPERLNKLSRIGSSDLLWRTLQMLDQMSGIRWGEILQL